MTRKANRVDQSGFPPCLRIEFLPNTEATGYRITSAPFGPSSEDSRRAVDSGFLDVALPELAELGLSDTIALLFEKLLRARARMSADGGGHPEGSHRWSTATLPGL